MRVAKAIFAAVRLWLSSTDGLAAATAVSLVLKLLLVRHEVLGGAFGFGAIVDAAAIIALVALAALAPERFRRPLLAGLAVAGSLVMLTGIVYASYFGELPSLGMLSVVGELGSVTEATGHLLHASELLYVIDLPLLLLAPVGGALAPASSRFRLAIVAFTGTALTLVAVVGASLFVEPVGASVCSYQFGLIASQAGMAIASHASGSVSAQPSLQATIDSLTGHDVASRHPGAPAPGSLKGMNVIVVQMESLQAGLIGARVDGKPIVPQLEKLADESVYFPNAYSQIGRGNTSDAEFVTNTSLYPCLEEPSAVAYAKKALPGLPRLLNDAGYSTLTMHTNDATYWNRDHLYPALGFQSIFDKSYFGDAQWAGFGASDKVLFDRGVLLLRAAAAEGRPFYAQMVTVSAHYPFTHTGGTAPLKLDAGAADTETGRYLSAQSYADAQLGRFVKKLRKAGLLDKTILVVYGDHFGLRLGGTDADKQMRKDLFGHEYNASDFYNVPLLIRLPDGKGMRDEAVVGQVDIMPTIADLVGLDLTQVPHFGKSVFEDSRTLLTRASSVDTLIDGSIAYFRGMAQGDGAYSPVTHVRQENADAPRGLADARRLVALSQEYARSLPDQSGSGGKVGHIPSSALNPTPTPYR